MCYTNIYLTFDSIGKGRYHELWISTTRQFDSVNVVLGIPSGTGENIEGTLGKRRGDRSSDDEEKSPRRLRHRLAVQRPALPAPVQDSDSDSDLSLDFKSFHRNDLEGPDMYIYFIKFFTPHLSGEIVNINKTL